MDVLNKRIKNIDTVLIVYCLIFFTGWTLYTFFISPVRKDNLSELTGSILSAIIKVSTWTIPCIFLLKKYSKDVVVPVEDMFINKFKIRPYIIGLSLLALCLIGISYIENGSIAISKTFDPISLIGVVLFVGITEEMVFRGWILNVLLTRMKLIYALIIDAILFLSIHFPIWIYKGIFYENLMSGSFISVIILSIMFSMLFIKSKNILVPIVFHMVWNLLVTIF